MTALTLRIPEDQHRRLKALARQRGVSINHLLDEATTLLLTEFDAETRSLLLWLREGFLQTRLPEVAFPELNDLEEIRILLTDRV